MSKNSGINRVSDVLRDGSSDIEGPNSLELTKEVSLSLGATLGTCPESGTPVFQFNRDRFRHTLILGRTGSGKSNLVKQMEREDIRSGAGVFILAAHEEDALYPLSCVPEERLGDVVFVDASNPDFLPKMNPLDIDTHDHSAVDKAINDVLELLTMDCEYSWAGPRFEQYLRYGLSLLLMHPFAEEHDIAKINRLYVDPDYVKSMLAYCTDQATFDYWTKVIPRAMNSGDEGEVIDWFLSKTSRFVNDHRLRHMFGAGKSTIDIGQVVDEGKIFVAYVPESRIGASAARAISKWLLMKLRDAIMNRRGASGTWHGLNYSLYEDGESRTEAAFDPFFVYVDEFARFASSDFESLLSEARKQNVGFVLSTQTLSQTRIYDKKAGHTSDALLEAVLGNVGTIISYPIGIRDAELLSEQFDVGIGKVKQIERYQPLARLCINNQSRVRTLKEGIRPTPDNPSAARRIAKDHMAKNIWVQVGEEDAQAEANPIWDPELPSTGSGLEDMVETVPDDMMDDPFYSFSDVPLPMGSFNGTENGFGHAYRYVDPKTGAVKLTPDYLEALDATLETNSDYEIVKVYYENGEIDHVASKHECKEELEERIMKGIFESLSAAEIEELYHFVDAEKARQWLQRKKDEHQDIVESISCETKRGNSDL